MMDTWIVVARKNGERTEALEIRGEENRLIGCIVRTIIMAPTEKRTDAVSMVFVPGIIPEDVGRPYVTDES